MVRELCGVDYQELTLLPNHKETEEEISGYSVGRSRNGVFKV